MTKPPRAGTPQTPAEQRAADQAYYRRLLAELDEMGAELDRLRGRSPPAAGQRPRGARAANRAEILREVGYALRRSSHDIDPESLREELLDILEDDELEDELDEELEEELEDLDDDRPVAEIIAEICRDLGIAARMATRLPSSRPATPAPAADTGKAAATPAPVVPLRTAPPRERTGTAPPSGQAAGGANVLDARDRFRRR